MQLTRIALVALFGAAGLASVTAGAGGGPSMNVHESMQVDTGGGKVLVRLSFENRGARTVWVPRDVASEKELFGRRFEIREVASGQAIDYIGPMVKRGPLTKDDFLALKPHAVQRNTIDITNSYAFLPGPHTYEIRYAGNWVADVAKLDEQGASPPEPVRFTYSGK